MANLLDMHFRKTNLASHNEITFDADMLKLLMAIDEDKTIRQIAGDVALTPTAFKESLMKLIKLIALADFRKCFLQLFICIPIDMNTAPQGHHIGSMFTCHKCMNPLSADPQIKGNLLFEAE